MCRLKILFQRRERVVFFLRVENGVLLELSLGDVSLDLRDVICNSLYFFEENIMLLIERVG